MGKGQTDWKFLSTILEWFGGYAIVLSTLVYTALSVSLELWAPQCIFVSQEDRPTLCLQNGVDNSTSTIMTGLFTSACIFGLAIHLWSIKCCYAPRLQVPFQDDKGNIRPSGILAQFLMGISVLLQTLARILDPNANLGHSTYWLLYAASFPMAAFSIDYHAYFAKKSLQNRWTNFFCCRGNGGCLTHLGFQSFLVMTIAFLVFAAGISCAALEEGDGNLSNTTFANATIGAVKSQWKDNIFDTENRMRVLQEEEEMGDTSTAESFSTNSTTFLNLREFHREHICQNIVYLGGYTFLFGCFFFWYTASRVLSRAVVQRQLKASAFEEDFWIWGLHTKRAVRMIPWISFAIGHLYPVWVWLASDFANRYWLEVSILAREGIIYHYGLLVLSILAHNWCSALTYRGEDGTVFTGDELYETAVEIYERKQREQAAFHDLTFGMFEPEKSPSAPKQVEILEEASVF